MSWASSSVSPRARAAPRVLAAFLTTSAPRSILRSSWAGRMGVTSVTTALISSPQRTGGGLAESSYLVRMTAQNAELPEAKLLVILARFVLSRLLG